MSRDEVERSKAEFRRRLEDFQARRARIEGREPHQRWWKQRVPPKRMEVYGYVLLLSFYGGLPLMFRSPFGYSSGHAPGASAKVDLATLSSALQSFRLDMGRYPTTQEGLGALIHAPASLRRVWQGPYLTKPVGLDPWGNPYVYRCPGQNGKDSYTVESYGSDGQPGGEGDAADIVENGSWFNLPKIDRSLRARRCPHL